MNTSTARPAGVVLRSPGLSPWPEAADTQGRAKAIAILRSEAGMGASPSDDEVSRIGSAAAALVERDGPKAPQDVKDEAMIRFAAYIYGTTKSQGFHSEALGPKSRQYATHNHAAMFRHCGAKALLAPWKVRRAGAIG